MRSLETTRTGVRIGLAYVPPPCKRWSADAELVQRALLAKRVRLMNRLRAWLRDL